MTWPKSTEPKPHGPGSSAKAFRAASRRWLGFLRQAKIRSLTIVLASAMLAGCAAGSSGTASGMCPVYFVVNPIRQGTDEAVEQLEFSSEPMASFRVGRLPTDWAFGITSDSKVSSCTLNCAHQHFAVADIHVFDGLVHVGTTDGKTPEIAVRVWITRGPRGEGRIVDLPAGSTSFAK